MRKIPLTQGKVALVDDVDYKYLSQWKWFAQKDHSTFYARRDDRAGPKKVAVLMHQVIAQRLGFKHKADHINRNGLDNRRSNLRDATHGQNCQNRSLRADNKSGYPGIRWIKQRSKWRVTIGYQGKEMHLGYFSELKDAIVARQNAERKFFSHT